MTEKPPPPDEPAEVFTHRAALFFSIGVALYGLGFWLLKRGYGDAAPLILVAGILLMVWALL